MRHEASDLDSTRRFAERVESYRAARPTYPAELFDFLHSELGLRAGTRVADLGSGTGIFCRPLLARGVRLWAVEPNAAMRSAAEQELGDLENFISIDGTAEDTSLDAESIDLVTAAQSFHWFDLEGARSEALRILDPRGQTALIWNMRPESGSRFLGDYEQFLVSWGPQYQQVKATYQVRHRLDAFFAPGWNRRVFEHGQALDAAALVDRVLSSSYMPNRGDATCDDMLQELERLFGRHAVAGRVVMAYESEVWSGRVRAP